MDDVRAFLDQIAEYKCRVRRCERKVAELQSECEKVTTSWSAVGGGGSGDCHKDFKLIALTEKKAELEKLKAEQRVIESDVEKFIDSLPDFRHREIMKLRYIDLMRWPQIYDELSDAGLPYSERQMFRMHGDALQAARRAWKEREKCVTNKR